MVKTWHVACWRTHVNRIFQQQHGSFGIERLQDEGSSDHAIGMIENIFFLIGKSDSNSGEFKKKYYKKFSIFLTNEINLEHKIEFWIKVWKIWHGLFDFLRFKRNFYDVTRLNSTSMITWLHTWSASASKLSSKPLEIHAKHIENIAWIFMSLTGKSMKKPEHASESGLGKKSNWRCEHDGIELKCA